MRVENQGLFIYYFIYFFNKNVYLYLDDSQVGPRVCIHWSMALLRVKIRLRACVCEGFQTSVTDKR